MDKWSRPIFRLDADGKAALHLRHEGAGSLASDDVQRAILLRAREESKKEQVVVRDNTLDALFAENNDHPIERSATASSEEVRMRARAPINQGFLFTVQPESAASIVKGADSGGGSTAKRSNNGEMDARDLIAKKCLENKGKKASVGLKSNPRAMTVEISRYAPS